MKTNFTKFKLAKNYFVSLIGTGNKNYMPVMAKYEEMKDSHGDIPAAYWIIRMYEELTNEKEKSKIEIK